ncbi:hypothetical protein IJ541_08935 [bacterium]|nr:hypothetical protein [bacterium]MBQ9246005.1 hypothetical protein [bacterium]MBQ9246892.1 hypothetical protein [bacterium]
MTKTEEKTVLFDPGYAQHTTILSISAEYIYANLEQFKNFGQKKFQFKMAYPKLTHMADNNVGFCLGSLLWAVYIKSLGNVQIEGNPCLGGEYDEKETVEEADYSIEFFNKLKKDAKYYIGADYKIDSRCVKVLELYKEFLILNKGFVDTKTTNDVLLPQGFVIPSEENLEKIHSKIQEVIKSGKLLDLFEVFDLAYIG